MVVGVSGSGLLQSAHCSISQEGYLFPTRSHYSSPKLSEESKDETNSRGTEKP